MTYQMGVVGLSQFLGEEARGQLPTMLYCSDSIMFNRILTAPLNNKVQHILSRENVTKRLNHLKTAKRHYKSKT